MSGGEIAVATIVAGAISGGAASILTLLYNSAQERRDRHREHFSRALETVVQYEEFPYIVRRRNAAEPETERIRISTELRAVQSNLSYHCAWLKTESGRVGKTYAELVAGLRTIAGGLMHDGWDADPIRTDAEMNIPDIGPELSKLKPHKDRYLREVMDHLSIWPGWSLRLGRALRCLPTRLRRRASADTDGDTPAGTPLHR